MPLPQIGKRQNKKSITIMIVTVYSIETHSNTYFNYIRIFKKTEIRNDRHLFKKITWVGAIMV